MYEHTYITQAAAGTCCAHLASYSVEVKLPSTAAGTLLSIYGFSHMGCLRAHLRCCHQLIVCCIG